VNWREGHAVGREQRKANLVGRALAALRRPSRRAPCIMSVLVVHVVQVRVLVRHKFLIESRGRWSLAASINDGTNFKGPGV
jgi:hypothetical protein